MDEDILKSDALQTEHMIRGSIWLRNAIEQARGVVILAPHKSLPPPHLIWSEGRGLGRWQAVGGSETAKRQARNVEHLMAEKERRRELAVKRDPCPRCGIRADIGCEHLRVA